MFPYALVIDTDATGVPVTKLVYIKSGPKSFRVPDLVTPKKSL